MAIGPLPLSLTELYTEFGAPAGTPLSAFVRGGAWVPDSPANAGIPTTLPISLSQFVGASAQQVNAIPATITDAVASPTDATASYQMTSAGVTNRIITSGTTSLGNWLISGAAADFDVRATVTSGTLTSGSNGVWENLASTRTWNRTRTTNVVGTDTVIMTIEIRPAGGGATLDSATVTLNAEVA